MVCRLCGENKPLVRAHIIPAGFFRRLQTSTLPLRMLSSSPDTFPKRAPAGVWDSSILCADCERLFNECDDYGQKILTEPPVGLPKTLIDGRTVGWESADYNYDLMKRFVVAVLWRASVSEHAFFKHVNLGSHDEEARLMIVNNEVGAPEHFAVTLARLGGVLGGTVLDPYSTKIDGVNHCLIYLGSYVAYVKVDRRPSPPTLQPFILKPREPLKIVHRESADGREFAMVHGLLRLPHNNR